MFLRRESGVATESATASILNGAHLVRVHDVKAMRTVVEVVDSIKQFVREEESAAPAQARWQRGQ